VLLHDGHKKQGKHMTDTLELLETIGQDASLRHASAEELVNILEQAQASEALRAAVAAGDSTLLSAEFGHQVNFSGQSVQTTPGHEEEEEQEDDDGDGDAAESLASEVAY
jgi:hypothetical protein